MRPPRFRFTVRRMMVAVAVAAILIATPILAKRRSHYVLQAAFHQARERKFRRDVDTPPLTRSDMRTDLREDHERRDRLRVVYHEGLRRKYERLARYPWLPVEPDPPEPE